MEKLLKDLIERREQLEAGVFSHPPDDWSEFQRRFGRWQELSDQINEITNRIDEDDDT